MLGELSLRFGPRRDETAAEAQARLKLLMQDVSAALDIDALRSAIRDGVRLWKFMPTCAEVCEVAKDFIADRRADNRRAQVASTPRLADHRPPELADRDAMERAKLEAYAKIDADSVAMTGRTGPRIEAQVKARDDRPFTDPTAATLAEVKAALDAKWAA